MTDVDGLIARLEAATEGSRELDRAIDLMLNPEAEIYRHVIRYTTSLDAAVPGEDIWMVRKEWVCPDMPTRWCAKDETCSAAGYGNTEPLARRAAALRARAMMGVGR